MRLEKLVKRSGGQNSGIFDAARIRPEKLLSGTRNRGFWGLTRAFFSEGEFRRHFFPPTFRAASFTFLSVRRDFGPCPRFGLFLVPESGFSGLTRAFLSEGEFRRHFFPPTFRDASFTFLSVRRDFGLIYPLSTNAKTKTKTQHVLYF